MIRRALKPLLYAWIVIGWMFVIPLWIYLGMPISF